MTRYHATSRDLVGRKIVAADFRPWRDGRNTYHNPVFTLDNGKKIWFATEETGTEYGTAILITRKD